MYLNAGTKIGNKPNQTVGIILNPTNILNSVKSPAYPPISSLGLMYLANGATRHWTSRYTYAQRPRHRLPRHWRKFTEPITNAEVAYANNGWGQFIQEFCSDASEVAVGARLFKSDYTACRTDTNQYPGIKSLNMEEKRAIEAKLNTLVGLDIPPLIARHGSKKYSNSRDYGLVIQWVRRNLKSDD